MHLLIAQDYLTRALLISQTPIQELPCVFVQAFLYCALIAEDFFDIVQKVQWLNNKPKQRYSSFHSIKLLRYLQSNQLLKYY